MKSATKIELATRHACWIAAVTVAGMCVSFSPTARAEDSDLDDLPPAKLRRALEAELDDVLQRKLPDTEEGLIDAFVSALRDDADGDGDDADELVISWSQLVHEMEEAHTSVRAVVAGGVHEALHPSSAEPPGDEPPSEDDQGVDDHEADPDELGTIGQDKAEQGWRGAVAWLFAKVRGSR